MVHRREVNGNEIIFGNQGDLLQNAMTLFDHESGSVWSQPTGEAVLGPRKGESLDLLPSTLTTWETWQETFPDTLALDVDTRSNNFGDREFVAVVALNDEHVAINAEALRAGSLVTTMVAGATIVVAEEQGVWTAYEAEVDGQVLDLSREGSHIVDQASGDRWDILRGNSTVGGDPLVRLPVFSSFPSDYERIFNEG